MELVRIEINKQIGTITLNRPEKRNALNGELVSALKDAFTQLEASDEVKIIILKGEGKAFCAGADLAYLQELQNNSYEENLQDSMSLKALFYQIYTLKKVVIAQVQGHAIAGGCGLATVCDFAFSVPHAKFGYTEVRIGFVPAIVKLFLLRKIGEGKAKELLLTGELITAERAEKYGLINRVVSEEDLSASVLDFANTLIKQNSATSMGITKTMIAEIQGMNIVDGLNYAAEMNAKAREQEDCKKGIAAFLNEEKIIW